MKFGLADFRCYSVFETRDKVELIKMRGLEVNHLEINYDIFDFISRMTSYLEEKLYSAEDFELQFLIKLF